MWDARTAMPTEFLPALDLPEPAPQRRLTVLLRLLLLVPQFIVLWVLTVVAFVVVVIGWFGALVLGRLPTFAASYLSSFLAYDTRVYAYLTLLVDHYPPFALHPFDQPVRIEVRPGELNRLAVFFRLILLIPAAIVQNLLISGWWVAALVCWLVVLINGRPPRPLFEATAAALRYRMRFQAYGLMLSSAYPKRLFGDPAVAEPSAGAAPAGYAAEHGAGVGEGYGAGVSAGAGYGSATRPLVLGGAGKALVVVFLVLGLASSAGGSFGGSSSSTNDNTDVGTISTVHHLPSAPSGR